jgi:hypothetical protein
MKTKVSSCLIWIKHCLFKCTCCQTHTLSDTLCRIQVIGIKLALSFNHWWKIVCCIFWDSTCESITWFSSIDSILSSKSILEAISNIMTLPHHGINWWVTVLLSSCPSTLSSIWYRRKLRTALAISFCCTHLALKLGVDFRKFRVPSFVIKWLRNHSTLSTTRLLTMTLSYFPWCYSPH